MPRAYSLDLRERLLKAMASGLSAAEIERLTGVDATTVRRWRSRQARGASLVPGRAPGRAPGRVPTIGPAQWDTMRAQVAASPDATLDEHCTIWDQTHGQRVSRATMSRLLRRINAPLKKSP